MNLLSKIGQEENKDRMVSQKTHDEVVFCTNTSQRGSRKSMGSADLPQSSLKDSGQGSWVIMDCTVNRRWVSLLSFMEKRKREARWWSDGQIG